jgi:hypothetical protein
MSIITISELAKKTRGLGLSAFTKVFPEPALVFLLGRKSRVDSLFCGDVPEGGLIRTDVFFQSGELPITDETAAESWVEGGNYSIEVGSPVFFLARDGDCPELAVGRDESCDIELPFATVSARHALLVLTSSIWQVADQQSTNGTYLDGAMLEPGKPASLADHATIAFGPEVRVEFLLPKSLFDVLGKHRTAPTMGG